MYVCGKAPPHNAYIPLVLYCTWFLTTQDSEYGDEIFHELVVYKNDFDCYELLIKLDEEGHYVGRVTYEGVRIGPPKFTIISLSGKMSVCQSVCHVVVFLNCNAFMVDLCHQCPSVYLL